MEHIFTAQVRCRCRCPWYRLSKPPRWLSMPRPKKLRWTNGLQDYFDTGLIWYMVKTCKNRRTWKNVSVGVLGVLPYLDLFCLILYTLLIRSSHQIRFCCPEWQTCMTTQNASTCISGWISCCFSPINSSKLVWQVPPVRTFGFGIWRGKPRDRPSDVTGYWHRISRIHWWMSFGAIHYHSLIDRQYWRIMMWTRFNAGAAAQGWVAWKDKCLAPEKQWALQRSCRQCWNVIVIPKSFVFWGPGRVDRRGKLLEHHMLFTCFFLDLLRTPHIVE